MFLCFRKLEGKKSGELCFRAEKYTPRLSPWEWHCIGLTLPWHRCPALPSTSEWDPTIWRDTFCFMLSFMFMSHHYRWCDSPRSDSSYLLCLCSSCLPCVHLPLCICFTYFYVVFYSDVGFFSLNESDDDDDDDVIIRFRAHTLLHTAHKPPKPPQEETTCHYKPHAVCAEVDDSSANRRLGSKTYSFNHCQPLLKTRLFLCVCWGE